MERGKHFWLPFLTRFKNAALLMDAIKEADQFIRYPKLFGVDCDGFELPLLKDTGHVLCKQLSLPWDGIITDEATRKIIFVQAMSSPQEIGASRADAALRLSFEKGLKSYFPEADPQLWLSKYGELAERILWLQILNDPTVGCLEQGYRSEIVFLELVNDTTEEAYTMSAADWQRFTAECIEDLAGSNNGHLLCNVFFTDLPL